LILQGARPEREPRTSHYLCVHTSSKCHAADINARNAVPRSEASRKSAHHTPLSSPAPTDACDAHMRPNPLRGGAARSRAARSRARCPLRARSRHAQSLMPAVRSLLVRVILPELRSRRGATSAVCRASAHIGWFRRGRPGGALALCRRVHFFVGERYVSSSFLSWAFVRLRNCTSSACFSPPARGVHPRASRWPPPWP